MQILEQLLVRYHFFAYAQKREVCNVQSCGILLGATFSMYVMCTRYATIFDVRKTM